ncbi:MAG: hemolysin III family protein [Gammaproteobacteria bacterium]
MTASHIAIEHKQSIGEEISNSISHGLGLLLAIAALPVLIIHAAREGSASSMIGAVVFGSSAIMLYLSSLLYHATWHARTKSILQTLDHAAIYLLIAGTYTPFTLGVLRGAWGWTLFGLVWTMALAGLLFKICVGTRFPRVSTTLYIAMGWMALIAIRPLWLYLPVEGWIWLLAGGAAYTLGVVFFVLDARIRYGHFIWHLFVLAGTACHFVAVLRYAY